MLYQLPNGKVVHLSIEDYLELTHKDVQYLLSINAGEYIHNPWTESIISKTPKEAEVKTDNELEEAIAESVEEIETFFEEYFPEDFDDPEPRIDLDFNS
jgi:ABC-type transport system involved in cytochrome bd biosynthesis fused ATPase/permease subunit